MTYPNLSGRQAANQQNCLRWAEGGIDNPAPDAIRPHSPIVAGREEIKMWISGVDPEAFVLESMACGFGAADLRGCRRPFCSEWVLPDFS
jgi:hypothetical protein